MFYVFIPKFMFLQLYATQIEFSDTLGFYLFLFFPTIFSTFPPLIRECWPLLLA